jgi:hypothetical protein
MLENHAKHTVIAQLESRLAHMQAHEAPAIWRGAFAFPPGVTDNLTVGEASAPVGGICHGASRMTHDEDSAAQRRIFAVGDLTKAARLVELSIGSFAPVDDRALDLALGYIRGVLAYHKTDAPVPPTPAPLGDVRF